MNTVSVFLFQGDLVACGVLSGNRNFEGRIHPLTRANYLASPPLVIAYALAGTTLIDFEKEPLGEWSTVLSDYFTMLTLKVLATTIDAQWDGMGDVGSARYEPALLPPMPDHKGFKLLNSI